MSVLKCCLLSAKRASEVRISGAQIRAPGLETGPGIFQL